MPVEDNEQSARRFYEEVINARNVGQNDHHQRGVLVPDGGW